MTREPPVPHQLAWSGRTSDQDERATGATRLCRNGVTGRRLGVSFVMRKASDLMRCAFATYRSRGALEE